MPTWGPSPPSEPLSSPPNSVGAAMATLMLIDGNSLTYRAFFALPTDMATASGQVTNATFGFIAPGSGVQVAPSVAQASPIAW